MLYEKTHTTKRNKLGKFADDRCKANCDGSQWVSALAVKNLPVKRKNWQIWTVSCKNKKNDREKFSGDFNGKIWTVSRTLAKILAVKAITPLKPSAKPPIFMVWLLL